MKGSKMKIIKPINPIARAMLKLRRSPQVIPNKKKNRYPDIEDYDGVYIDMFTGEVKELDDAEDDDPHDEMYPTTPPNKKEK